MLPKCSRVGLGELGHILHGESAPMIGVIPQPPWYS